VDSNRYDGFVTDEDVRVKPDPVDEDKKPEEGDKEAPKAEEKPKDDEKPKDEKKPEGDKPKEKDKDDDGKAEDKKADEDKPDDGQPDENEGRKKGQPSYKAVTRDLNRTRNHVAALTRRAKTAEEELAALKTELQEAKARQPQEAEPDHTDYDDYQDYLEDFGKWKKRQIRSEKKKEDSVSRKETAKPEAEKAEDTKEPDVDVDLQTAQDELFEEFQGAENRYKDFKKVFIRDDLPVKREMVLALAETEDPVGVAYYLGKNEDETKRISRLGTIGQAMAIKGIDDRIKHRRKPEPKVSNAPEPIKPVGGNSPGTKSLEDLNFSEYENRRKKEDIGKGFW